MRKVILLALFLCAFTSLHAQEWQMLSNIQRRQLAGRMDTVKYKLPLVSARDSSRLDTATVLHISKFLNAFDEPNLFLDGNNNRTVRFTWLRSNGHPVMVKMMVHNGHVMLYWKECDGTGINNPGKLEMSRQKELSESAWRGFRRLAEKINPCKIDVDETDVNGKVSECIDQAEFAICQ
jgi:hypothetical protein